MAKPMPDPELVFKVLLSFKFVNHAYMPGTGPSPDKTVSKNHAETLLLRILDPFSVPGRAHQLC